MNKETWLYNQISSLTRGEDIAFVIGQGGQNVLFFQKSKAALFYDVSFSAPTVLMSSGEVMARIYSGKSQEIILEIKLQLLFGNG